MWLEQSKGEGQGRFHRPCGRRGDGGPEGCGQRQGQTQGHLCSLAAVETPCGMSPFLLLLQAKKSAKKLSQSSESARRPSQKEKRGRPEDKPRARSAPIWPVLPELPREPCLHHTVPRSSASWGPLTLHEKGPASKFHLGDRPS